MAEMYPPYDDYQKRAGSRQIPVVVLELDWLGMNECEAHRGNLTLAFLRANRDGELSDRTIDDLDADQGNCLRQ